MKFFKIFLGCCFGLIIISVAPSYPQTATYLGSQACQGCHSGTFGNQHTVWSQSLHSKIHLPPDKITVKGDFT